MTRLTIIPNVEKKRLVFDGRIASGEHVELRVAGFGDKIEEGRLRVRAVDFHGNTLAVFPGKVKDYDGNVEKDGNRNDVWEKWDRDDDYGYATCLFNLNTIPALKYFRRGGECLIVLDDPELNVLYGSGHVCVLPWPKEIGEDEPVDLDAYPDNIKEFGERLDGVEKDVEGFGENVADALSKSKTANNNANDALKKAQSALEASNDAKTKSENAVNASNTAEGLIEKADELVEAAKNYAQGAKRVVDSLSDVAKSGSYNDLNDKPSIPSIAGLATTNDVEKSEARSRKELLEEVSRAKVAEDGLSRDIARKADTTALATETQRAMEAEASIRKELGRTATLDASGKIPSSQLPGFVDDVLEFASVSVFPDPGESGKIYISTGTNKQYRWSGSRYVEISQSLALGETAATAYPGNKGLENAQKIANLQTSKQDKLDARQLAAVNSGITAEKLANLVAKDDVVPVGTGTEIVATIAGKQIRIPKAGDPSMVSDDAGNVIRADGSANVVGDSWTCNGVVLTKREGRENYWENLDRHWGLGYNGGTSWLFTNGTGFASASAPADAKAVSFQIDGTTYSAKIGRADSVLMTGDVQPQGDGTEVIAVIGGKEIKAPAGGGVGTVKSVANVQPNDDGNVPLTAEDIGALPITGGAVGKLSEQAGSLVLLATYSSAPFIELSESFAEAGAISVPDSAIYKNTGSGPRASIKKGGKEVATEEYVDGMAKYPVVQKSGTTVMLEDRKVNVYSGTLSSDVTLVLPARNADGRVRDLEFRANVSGLRIVGVSRTDASGAAVALFSMSPESSTAEEGVNAWYFTETGGEVRVERALLKPAGFQVKMDFTCATSGTYVNDVEFLDSAGEKIKSIAFKNQKLSEIVSGVASLRINMSSYGDITMNGTKYVYASGSDPRTITLTGDSVITSSWADACLTPDTPILTPSGQVPLKDIHVGDTVLGVDHRGVLRTVRVTRCDTHLEKWHDACDRWTFARENGDEVVVTTVNRHRFYNVERGAMVYMDEWTVGEHGRDSDGCELELVSHEHVDGPARHMTLFTETQTYFAHGLLSGNRHTPHIDWEDR